MGLIHFHAHGIRKTMMTNTPACNAASNVNTANVKSTHPRRSMPKTLYAIRRRRQVKTDKIDVKNLNRVENHLKFLYVSPNK